MRWIRKGRRNILLFVSSLLLGIMSLIVFVKVYTNISFGSNNCPKYTELAKIDLILGELLFVIFSCSLFFLIVSINVKNVFAKCIKILILAGQILVTLVFMVIGVLFIFSLAETSCTSQIIQITGRSMQPTFEDKQMTTEYTFKEKIINRGCLVLLKPDTYEGQPGVVIKRVVGLPNEKIRISLHGVYIDDKLLDEPYALTSAKDDGLYGREWTISPGYYFLLGDNRDYSEDSRKYGPVSISQIEGYALDPKNSELNTCK